MNTMLSHRGRLRGRVSSLTLMGLALFGSHLLPGDLFAACTPTPITPYIQVNGAAWQQTASVTVAAGSVVNLGPQPLSGSWAWTGPNGFTSTLRQINGIALSTGVNTYVATYTNASSCKTTQAFAITQTGFTLSPSVSSLSVAQGNKATDTITVASVGGFSGSVTLAASGLPSGVTASFGTNPATGSSVLTLTAGSSATVGTSTITITGSSGKLTASTNIALTVTKPSFTLSPSASTLSVIQSSNATDTITVIGAGGFTGSVTLAASGLPSGVTVSFGTNPATGSSILTLTASSSATLGTFTIAINGTSGSLTASTTIALTVNKPPSFTLSPSAPTLTVTQGSKATGTITVTGANGFSGSVTLAASGLPTGVTASFGTNPTTGSSVLTLSASSSATVGVATVTITGTSGSLAASTNIALTVNLLPPSFQLSPSASSLSVPQGSNGTDTITVTGVGGFSGSVTLSASGLPSGVTASFGTNPATASSVLTLTASSSATTGTSTVTITGTSGSLSASTTVALTVNAPSFTLSRSASNLTVVQGSSGTDTVTVVGQNGFSGSVALAVSGLPSGVTAIFGTNPVSSSTLLTLFASTSAPAGAYTVTITGTFGSLTASTTVALTVSKTTCTPTPITPYIQVNGAAWQGISSVTVPAGASVNLGPQPLSGGSWSWLGPTGHTSNLREIDGILLYTGLNTYVATFTNFRSCKSNEVFLVTEAGFTLSSSMPALSVNQGSNAADTIIVSNAGGFNGSITLAASGLPTGVTASFGTNPTTGSSVLIMTASGSATAGTYTVTITGTSSSLTASTTVALTVSPDTTPPTAPTGLTATAAGSHVSLSWTASTDNVGVTGYRVERCLGAGCTNFAQIGTSATAAYSDTGLSAGSYSYRVRASDGNGNLSGYSNTATASILIPSAPANVTAVDGGPAPAVVAVQSYINSTFLTTHTTAPFDSTGGDLIVLCTSSHSGVNFTPTDSFGNTWIPIAGPTNTKAAQFDMRMQIWYARNAIVGPGHTITMGLSTVEPLVMSIVVVQGSNTSSPIDNTSLIGSDNGTASVSVASPSLTTGLSNDLLIGFAKVSAGATFTAGPGFTLLPAASSNFLAAETAPAAAAGNYQAAFTIDSGQNWQAIVNAVSSNPNQTTLSWTASTELGGTVASYLVERCQGAGCVNFVQIGTTTGTTFNDIGLTGATVYNYRVRAQDTASTDGPYSSVATVTTPAPIPSTPSAPGNLTSSGLTFVAAQSLTDPAYVTSHTTAPFDSTGGDLIVLCADSMAGVTFTPTDNLGNTWIPIAGPTSTTTGADERTQLWYAQNPIVGPGHTITINLSAGQPLVLSAIVLKGSYISSPIDAVSLIGSDNGTQSANVVSPNITTSAFNDMLIGFAKVSSGADFLSGPTFTEPAASSSSFLDAEIGPAAAPGTYAAPFLIFSNQTWQSAVVAVASSPNQITLSWTPAAELGGTYIAATIGNYLVERCQNSPGCSFVQIGTTSGATFTDTTVTGSASYSYRVRAQDTANALSPYSNVVTVTTTSAIARPQNLTATAASGTEIDLAWSAAVETGGTIVNYVVQRCLADAGINSTGQPCAAGFTTLTTVPGSATTYQDLGLTGGIFSYRVQAVDSANNLSLFSNVANASVPDTLPPSTPANQQATASLTNSQIGLTWGQATDNVGVTGYLVERCLGSGCSNFARIATTTTASYNDTGLSPNTTYSYCISATDAAGNVSPCPNATAMATTPNLTGPSATGTPTVSLGGSGPTVVAVQNLLDSASTTVHTTAPFNSTGADLIVLYAYTLPGVTLTPSDTLNNIWIPIAGPATTTSGGNLLTELWYAWNPKVGPADTITITLSPAGEPLLISVLVLQNADASSPIDAVSLIGSNSGSSTVISPSIATTGVNDLLIGFAATSANVTFTPVDGFTLQAGASDVVLAAETAPAATPGIYTAAFLIGPSEAWQSAVVAALNNPNQATVSWSPASGNILNYFVWRCVTVSCSNFELVGTVPAASTTFIDTGLAASTSYTYEVQAEDATLTVGPFSGTATLVTPGPTPSLPGNLTVTTSGTTNTLSWIPSQELGGTVSGYVVQSCQGVGCSNFVTIGTPPVVGPNYSDLNVNPSTSYTYRVQAVDSFNSLSPFSNIATVVTPAP